MAEHRKKLVTNFALGISICVLTVWLGWTEGERWSLRLCDATFTAAVLLLGIGLLHHFSNIGLFRVMSYGFKITWETFFPMAGSHRDEDFNAYRERKEEGIKSPKAMLIAGSAYLALSLVLLAVYYLVPNA